ncbi:MAG: isoprenoid biosynthesis glyoxalase ElbB [Lentimicrobiaceae bacterium]|jgi:enhancing lycopene biosynthesis protein 2|nr:isoprenoid biosynthesis glyoxalase ElbB [Lentimicrobiaceae bacterium]
MKKFAVILSGSGKLDGSEIHEATLLLLAIDQEGAKYQCFAPDIDQFHVVNHLTGEVTNEKRNVLVEAARIARGDIKPLSEFRAENFDALVLPGGFGAAKNLSTFAFDGAEMTVHSEVEQAIRAMYVLKKPIGAMCIAPTILAKVLGNVNLTIGDDHATAEVVTKLGANQVQTENGDVVVDNEKNIFSTPCYMLKASIADVYEGAINMVEAMMEVLNDLRLGDVAEI